MSYPKLSLVTVLVWLAAGFANHHNRTAGCEGEQPPAAEAAEQAPDEAPDADADTEEPAPAVRSGPRQGPDPEKVIAKAVHQGQAGGPPHNRNFTYQLKTDAPHDLATTEVWFQAWMSRQRDSFGHVFLSTDGGGNWVRIYSWSRRNCLAARSQGNWHTINLARFKRAIREPEADSLQIRFQYVTGNDHLEIRQVVWSGK